MNDDKLEAEKAEFNTLELEQADFDELEAEDAECEECTEDSDCEECAEEKEDLTSWELDEDRGRYFLVLRNNGLKKLIHEITKREYNTLSNFL